MEINLSDETIKTVYNSLRSSKQNLERQLAGISNGRAKKGKKEIIEYQLTEVEDALFVFEELMEII